MRDKRNEKKCLKGNWFGRGGREWSTDLFLWKFDTGSLFEKIRKFSGLERSVLTPIIIMNGFRTFFWNKKKFKALELCWSLLDAV